MGKNFESDSDDENNRSRSRTPQAAPTPGFSLEHHDSRSRSQSPNSQRSGSASSKGSSGSHRSSRSRSGSHKSRSASPANRRSRSGSNASRKSGGGTGGNDSPKSNKSHGSGSPASRKSRSRSRRSGTGSGHSDRSKSGTPQNRSRSRSGSGSNRSGSNASRKSQDRSRSGSAVSGNRSRSGSNASRKSGSPVTNSKEKRKRAVLSDSDSNNEQPATQKAKKSGLIDSDSEEEIMNEKDEGVTADALFGDDVDDISDDEEQGKKSGSEKSDREEKRDDSDARRSKTPDRARSRSGSKSSDDRNFERIYQNLDDEKEKEPEPEPEPLPETRIDVEIPRIVTNLGRDIHFVKMPNFLSVETRPFDVDQYEDEIDEEDVMDEEGRQRLKLKVGNTIRWREVYDKEGRIQRESNARFVKWSDGSMSLHLGSEIFDVYKQPLAGDHNHLFIRQGTGLQGQAVFRTKLTFRPHSTESSTHKKMTMSLADRSTKTSGIKILTQVGHDPDADRYGKLKAEEEKLRQAMRARAGHAKQPKRSSSGAGHNASYRDHDEASDDEGTISIAAIKGKFKKDTKSKQSASAIYSSDEEGSDIETRRKKKAGKSKGLRALDEEDGGSSDDNEGSEHKSGSEHSGSGSGDDKSEESD